MAKVTRRRYTNMSRSPSLVTQRARQRIGRRKAAERCKGGALDGHTLYLMSAGTLPFTLNGMKGYYNSFMDWVAL